MGAIIFYEVKEKEKVKKKLRFQFPLFFRECPILDKENNNKVPF
jgi:predicted oxidoreductase (fatty acid repression mutant protein)